MPPPIVGRPALLFERASIRTFVPAEAPVVYRIYGDVERTQLLYVGASIQPRKRLLQHLGKPELAGGVIVDIEVHRNTTAMARAEREAIAEGAALLETGPARRHHAWKAQNR